MRREVQNLVNTAAPLLPVYVHDKVDTAPHVVFDGVDAQSATATHDQRSDPMDGFFGAAGMDGGERSTVACVQTEGGLAERDILPCMRRIPIDLPKSEVTDEPRAESSD